MGRARDGQPRQRPRPRGIPTGSCADAMALPPSARQQQVLDLAHPRRLRLHRRAAARAARRVPHRLPEVGPQPRPASMPAAGPRASPACTSTRSPLYRLLDELKAAPPRAGDRELRVGRRPRRPRHPRSHRPHLDERQPRPARAAREPALHRPRRAARDDGHAPHEPGRALHRAARSRSTSARPSRCSATSASSGTSPPSTRRPATPIAGVGRARQAPRGRSSRPGRIVARRRHRAGHRRARHRRRGRGIRRLHHHAGRRPASPTRPAGSGCRGSTPTAATRVRIVGGQRGRRTRPVAARVGDSTTPS